MGNPLKIRKYQDMQVIDQGFPNDGTTNNGYNGDYPGIVGGINENGDQIECQARVLTKGLGTIDLSTASTTVAGTGTHFTTDALNGSTLIYISDGAGGYTTAGIWSSTTNDGAVELTANSAVDATGAEWWYSTLSWASIVRQKGSRTFLVVANNLPIQDESIAAGQMYMIGSAGTTDWSALGAPANASEGCIFTASVDGTGLTTTGVVYVVGHCLLVNDAAPPVYNTMRVAINDGSGTTYASRLKNHFSINFATPAPGANEGDTYIATFFTSGTVDPATGLTWATTENWC